MFKTWNSWNSRKKCKWICLMGMIISLMVVLAGVVIGEMKPEVDDKITMSLIAWGMSITTTFGLVVAGIHKGEIKEDNNAKKNS